MVTDKSALDCNEEKRVPLPAWLKRPIAHSGKQEKVKGNIHCKGLHTVCTEAKCPNRSECYSKGVATFLIMGNICTRNCSFCNVAYGAPQKLDSQEPENIVNAVKQLNLKHVVITSVTRDDLVDGGASHYASIVHSLKKEVPQVTIELLIPDFKGDTKALDTVLESRPDVLNHNIETVPRLYSTIRPQADFKRSLAVIERAHRSSLTTKSGLMLGLGEKFEEVVDTMKALLEHHCSILTIGQYLRPSLSQIEVAEYIEPQLFEQYSMIGKQLGFQDVFAGPFVRSSYRAEEVLNGVRQKEK